MKPREEEHIYIIVDAIEADVYEQLYAYHGTMYAIVNLFSRACHIAPKVTPESAMCRFQTENP